MYRWLNEGHHQRDYSRYYHEWLFGRRTLEELCTKLHLSYPTLQKHFDAISVKEGILHEAPSSAINLLIDATFFGREYGYLCFHDTEKIIYCQEIKTETVRGFKGFARGRISH